MKQSLWTKPTSKTKYCSDCNKTKKIKEFKKRTGCQKNMFKAFCQTCLTKRSKIWQKENRERCNVTHRKYYKLIHKK